MNFCLGECDGAELMGVSSRGALAHLSIANAYLQIAWAHSIGPLNLQFFWAPWTDKVCRGVDSAVSISRANAQRPKH